MKLTTAWASLTDRERRVITLALSCVTVGLVLGRGFPALSGWTLRERARRDMLADSLAVIHGVAAWHARSGGRAGGADRPLVSPPHPRDSALSRATAEAMMMAQISAASEDAGIDLTSLQVVAEPTNSRRPRTARAGVLQRVSLRTSGSGDIDAAFLSFVDTSRVPLVVRSLTVSPRQQQTSPDGVIPLSIDLVISALVQVSEAPSTERVP
jgi:hypothetical protein